MYETLFAYACLMSAGLIPQSEYGEYLNTHFMKTPDNELPLNLEWCFSDKNKTIAVIFEHCGNSMDYNAFGCFLMRKLNNVYFQNGIDIETFCSKLYIVWQHLPYEISQVEPFWTMSYASDPLSWGDEKQTRELCEKMLHFYGTERFRTE